MSPSVLDSRFLFTAVFRRMNILQELSFHFIDFKQALPLGRKISVIEQTTSYMSSEERVPTDWDFDTYNNSISDVNGKLVKLPDDN